MALPKTLVDCLQVFSARDKKLLLLITLAQSLFGVLDLLGVAIIGIIGALGISGIQSNQPGKKIQGFLEFLGIQNLSFQFQVGVLASCATLFLVVRSLASMYFSRISTNFLTNRGSVLSSKLINWILGTEYLSLAKRKTQDYVYATSDGVRSVMLGIIGSAISFFSDLTLLVVLGIGLALFDPVLASSTLVIFFLIGLLLFKQMHKRAEFIGNTYSKLSAGSNQQLVEVLQNFRPIFVGGRRSFFVGKLELPRKEIAKLSAEMTLMPFASKYIMEASVIVAAFILGVIQFGLQDSVHAVATLSVFLAAGTRIAPAILRLQQSAVAFRNSQGNASTTLELLINRGDSMFPSYDSEPDMVHTGFSPEISLTNVKFSYPNAESTVIDDISVSIKRGDSVAITGASGAGKSTLVDLIIGIYSPTSGKIRISGLPPKEAIAQWPGAIAYVPQEIMLMDGTIKENVCMGYSPEDVQLADVWRALRLSKLDAFVNEQPEGLDALVGETGSQLSGGQIQRLGIARALFTNPSLLILDESTSSLDAQTEAEITDAISGLRGFVTVIMVAHRLSTIRNADQVIYLSEGRIQSQGSFEFVRAQVPDFNNQATLMGL